MSLKSNLKTHLKMEGVPVNTQCWKALEKVLERIRDHEAIGWHMGFGTETFQIVTEAYAAVTGCNIEVVRDTYMPRSPADPAAAQPSKAPCLDDGETKTLEAVAVHLRKESGSTELMAGTICDQCGYERHQVADLLDTWATSLNSIAYRKGGK